MIHKWRGKVERPGWGGLGIARADDGRLILLSSDGPLFPGEEVEAEIAWKARHAEGKVTKWLSRDPRFDAQRAKQFDAAGFELWAAGSHAADLKSAMAKDLLSRSLPDAPQMEYVAAPEDALRQRIQLQWDGRNIGYHRRGSNELVGLATYPIAEPCLFKAAHALRKALRASELPRVPGRWELATGTPAGDVRIWRSGDDDSEPRAWQLADSGWQESSEPLMHMLGDAKLQQSAGVFSQACTRWAWQAFGDVLGGFDLRGDVLYDLYGGLGFFSRMLKGRFQRFVLAESSRRACADATANLAAQDAYVFNGSVAEWLTGAEIEAGSTVLLDPPRSGLTPAVCDALNSTPCKRIVLIGCDGAAFCRDAKRLGEARRLKRLSAIDLFPYTYELEFIGLFE